MQEKNYQVKELPKSEVEITFKLTDEEVQKHEKMAVERLSRNVKVKGFRPGHIPENILKKHIDPLHVKAYTQDLAIQRAYSEAVIKEKLQVVARPKVEIKSEEPLEFVAKVAVMPEVEVKGYKDIKIKKEEIKVTDKEVNAVLDDLKRHGTTYKDVERAVKKEDRVEADFEGFGKDGKALPGTASKNHPIIVGSNTMIPGFEDEIVGMKKDEEKEFELTFPKEYHNKDFQGKKVKFKLTVKRIEEGSAPKLDEAFIEKMTGKKQSLDDLKKDIKGNLKARKEEEAKHKLQDKYVEEVLKKTKVELPPALVHEEAHHILHEMKNDIAGKGVEFEEFLKRSNTTEEDLVKKYEPEAEKRIKIRLSLSKIIQEEVIKAPDKEIQAEYEKIKSMYPPDQQSKIEESYKSGQLKNELANRIALRKLFEKVL